jgi:hypothetical protein
MALAGDLGMPVMASVDVMPNDAVIGRRASASVLTSFPRFDSGFVFQCDGHPIEVSCPGVRWDCF